MREGAYSEGSSIEGSDSDSDTSSTRGWDISGFDRGYVGESGWNSEIYSGGKLCAAEIRSLTAFRPIGEAQGLALTVMAKGGTLLTLAIIDWKLERECRTLV